MKCEIHENAVSKQKLKKAIEDIRVVFFQKLSWALNKPKTGKKRDQAYRERLQEALMNKYGHDWYEGDYSKDELIETLLDFSRNGTKPVKNMNFKELFEEILGCYTFGAFDDGCVELPDAESIKLFWAQVDPALCDNCDGSSCPTCQPEGEEDDK
jgi:hypothetical protein